MTAVLLSVEQERALVDLGTWQPDHYLAKFCTAPLAWCAEAESVARTLKLCRQQGPLRILDIGCGLGYFAHVCQLYGHVVTVLDVPDPIIQHASHILKLSYIGGRILPNVPLPENLGQYDLITTFGVNFRDTFNRYWDEHAYTCLAAELRKHLNTQATFPGGRWVLRPNQTTDRDSPIANLMKPDWWQEVAGPDATITRVPNQVEITWKTKL